MHQGQQLKYAGGVTIAHIFQPYNLDGTMAEPVVELEQNGECWGFLTFTAVAAIEREEKIEAAKAESLRLHGGAYKKLADK